MVSEPLESLSLLAGGDSEQKKVGDSTSARKCISRRAVEPAMKGAS